MCKMVCADLAPKSYSSCNISFKFHWAGSTAHRVLSPFPGKWVPILPHEVRDSLCFPSSPPVYFYASISIWFLSKAAALRSPQDCDGYFPLNPLFCPKSKVSFFFPQHDCEKGLEGLKYILRILLLIFTLGSSIHNLPKSSSRKNFRT